MMSFVGGGTRAWIFSVRITNSGKAYVLSCTLSSERMFALRRRMIAGASSNRMNSGCLHVTPATQSDGCSSFFAFSLRSFRY